MCNNVGGAGRLLGAGAEGSPLALGDHRQDAYCDELFDFHTVAWGRYADFYFAGDALADVTTIIMWGAGSGFECAVFSRWAKLHGYRIRFVCVEKDAGRSSYNRALRSMEGGDWEIWTMDGLDLKPPTGEDWGTVCVHVDNFLFASWKSTLQSEFNTWLMGIDGKTPG